MGIDASGVFPVEESILDSIDMSNKGSVPDKSKTGRVAVCTNRFFGVCRLGSCESFVEGSMFATCNGTHELSSVSQARCGKGQAYDLNLCPS